MQSLASDPLRTLLHKHFGKIRLKRIIHINHHPFHPHHHQHGHHYQQLSCKSGQGEPGASATVFEVQGGENLPRLLDLISFSTQEVGGRYDDLG